MCQKHEFIIGLFFETFLYILQIFLKILKKKKKKENENDKIIKITQS